MKLSICHKGASTVDHRVRLAAVGLLTAGLAIGVTGCSKQVSTTPPEAEEKLIHGTPQQAGLSAQKLDEIDQLIEEGIQQRAFPGAVVLVARHGIIAFDKAYGYSAEYSDANFTRMPVPVRTTTETIYDLASLSKIFTTLAVMKLYDAGKIDLDAPVARYIPEFAQNGKASVTIRMLLTHTSGLPPGIPLWKSNLTVNERIEQVYREPLQHPPGSTYVYSDLNFIVLGKLIERISGEPLDKFVEQTLTEPLGMKDTMYNPPPTLIQRVAASEYQPWTHRGLIWGQVEDENAWALGGVAGHAGVFSTAEDLAILAQMVLNDGRYEGHQILKPGTVQAMEQVQTLAGHAHALGWEVDQPWYMGALASPDTLGHTGFSGTSIVVDTKDDLICILLTNRVHPTRSGPSVNPYRAQLADIVAEAIQHGRLALVRCTGRSSQCWSIKSTS
jgi:CubicO group peptidase (beta-lactamase class C family)